MESSTAMAGKNDAKKRTPNWHCDEILSRNDEAPIKNIVETNSQVLYNDIIEATFSFGFYILR